MADSKALSNPKLFHLLQEVLAQWTFLGADLRDPATPLQGPMLEYMVRLNGPLPVTLVLRCSPAVAAMMAEAATGADGVDAAVAADAFKELVNVVCGHLTATYWKRGTGPFQPFMPVPSNPNDWPPVAPTHRCVAAVEDQLIEVMVWNEPQSKVPFSKAVSHDHARQPVRV